MMEPSTLQLSLVHITTPTEEARQLLVELDENLGGAYSTEQQHALNFAQLFQSDIMFLVARVGDEAAGCGGVAFQGARAEIKRMYVRPAFRGRGVAQALLKRLEVEAVARSVKSLVLETGDVQHEALRLYESRGFKRCAAFGEYAVMPPAAIVRSLFYQKPIG